MKLKPLLAGFSLLAFAGAVQAQQQPQQQQQRQQPQQQTQAQEEKQQAGELRVSNLKNMEVVNAKGEDIGEISDVVIDLNSGRVHAVVLEFGGVLGVGEENYAFPITELKPGKQDNQLVMNVDKQALENRDGFAKSQFPGMDDEYWSRVGGKESQAAAGGSAQGQKMNLARASELMGKEVQDNGGKQAGEVEDVVVGLQNGEVRNFVVSVQDGGRAMVPAKSLKMSGTDDRLVIDMSADQLRSQAEQSGNTR